MTSLDRHIVKVMTTTLRSIYKTKITTVPFTGNEEHTHDFAQMLVGLDNHDHYFMTIICAKTNRRYLRNMSFVVISVT